VVEEVNTVEEEPEEKIEKEENPFEAKVKKVREDTNLSTWKKNKILKKLQDESFGSKKYF